MQIVVNDLLTNYQLQGQGKLVLVLHGWGDNLVGTKALQDHLRSEYTVLAIDLPGFGKTQRPPAAWRLDDYAQFVADVLTKLGLGDPYAIIGHSNGGAIAVRGTALQAIKSQKLILLAPAGIRSPSSARRSGLQVLAKVGNIATILLPASYRAKLRRALYQRAGSDMLVVEGMEDTFKNTVRQDVQEDAKKITQPTLLIFGQEDRAVTPTMAQLYKQAMPTAEYRMIQAGHFVHIDQPEQVTKLIEEFLHAA